MDDSYAPMDPNAPPNNPLSMPLPVEMLGMTNWLLPPDRPEGAPAEPNHQATTVGRAPGDMFGATGFMIHSDTPIPDVSLLSQEALNGRHPSSSSAPPQSSAPHQSSAPPYSSYDISSSFNPQSSSANMTSFPSSNSMFSSFAPAPPPNTLSSSAPMFPSHNTSTSHGLQPPVSSTYSAPNYSQHGHFAPGISQPTPSHAPPYPTLFMPSSLNARSSQQTPSSFTPPPDPRLPSAPYGQPSHTHQRGGGHYAPIPYEQGQSSSRPGEAMIPSTQQHPPGAIPAQYWDFNGHDEQNANGKRARQGSSPPATLRTRQNPAESMPPPPPPAAPDQAPQPGTHTHATQPPSNQGQSSDGDLPLTAPFVIPDSLTVAQANATNWVSGFQMLTGTGVTPEESEVALSVATSAFQTKEFIEEFLKFREVVRGIVNVDPRFVGLTQEQRHAIAEQWMIAELGRTGVKKAVSKLQTKVRGTMRNLIIYIINMVRCEDIFGLARFDVPGFRSVLRTHLGWLATTMAWCHLYFMHRRCHQIKLSDMMNYSFFCPQAGQTLFAWVTVAHIEESLVVAKSLGYSRVEQAEQVSQRKRNTTTQGPKTSRAKSKAAKAEAAPTCDQLFLRTVPLPSHIHPSDSSMATTSAPHTIPNADRSVPPPQAGPSNLTIEHYQPVNAKEDWADSDEIVVQPDAEPATGRYKAPRVYSDGMTRTRMKKEANENWEQDMLGGMMNFNGECLIRATGYFSAAIHEDYKVPYTGNVKSSYDILYEDQQTIEVGSEFDILHKQCIIPGAAICAVLKTMLDKGTMGVLPEEVQFGPVGLLTFDTKVLTSTPQMSKWVRDEPKEAAVLRGRLVNQGKVIRQTHPNSNFVEYGKDLTQTFLPHESDHLSAPNQSYCARNNIPPPVPTVVFVKDMEAERSKLLKSLPPTRHREDLQAQC